MFGMTMMQYVQYSGTYQRGLPELKHEHTFSHGIQVEGKISYVEDIALQCLDFGLSTCGW